MDKIGNIIHIYYLRVFSFIINLQLMLSRLSLKRPGSPLAGNFAATALAPSPLSA